jgi:hypothetical protein
MSLQCLAPTLRRVALTLGVGLEATEDHVYARRPQNDGTMTAWLASLHPHALTTHRLQKARSTSVTVQGHGWPIQVNVQDWPLLAKYTSLPDITGIELRMLTGECVRDCGNAAEFK